MKRGEKEPRHGAGLQGERRGRPAKEKKQSPLAWRGEQEKSNASGGRKKMKRTAPAARIRERGKGGDRRKGGKKKEKMAASGGEKRTITMMLRGRECEKANATEKKTSCTRRGGGWTMATN